MVAYHNNIKPCVLLAKEGVTYCPASEGTAMHLLPGGCTPQGGINGQKQRQVSRPAHLMRNIEPHL